MFVINAVGFFMDGNKKVKTMRQLRGSRKIYDNRFVKSPTYRQVALLIISFTLPIFKQPTCMSLFLELGTNIERMSYNFVISLRIHQIPRVEQRKIYGCPVKVNSFSGQLPFIFFSTSIKTIVTFCNELQFF